MPRPKGSLNHATKDARKAIAAFVDSNAGRLTGWLDQVSDGVLDPGDDTKYLVPPNPIKAFELFQSVVEYHVPKLARTELTGKDGEPIKVWATSKDESV